MSVTSQAQCSTSFAWSVFVSVPWPSSKPSLMPAQLLFVFMTNLAAAPSYANFHSSIRMSKSFEDQLGQVCCNLQCAAHFLSRLVLQYTKSTGHVVVWPLLPQIQDHLTHCLQTHTIAHCRCHPRHLTGRTHLRHRSRV